MNKKKLPANFSKIKKVELNNNVIYKQVTNSKLQTKKFTFEPCFHPICRMFKLIKL